MHSYYVGSRLRLGIAMLVALGIAFAATPAVASADDCAALGGSISGGECQISVSTNPVVGSGSYGVNETLHVLGGGKLNVAGNAVTINVTGDFIVDAGGQVVADVNGGNLKAGSITVNASGDVRLFGSGQAGALVSASQSGGNCTNAAVGGHGYISLTAGNGTPVAGDSNDVIVEDGAVIAADAKCPAGEIKLAAPEGKIRVDGDVHSDSALSGGGSGRRGGGPISLDAGCSVDVGDNGSIVSEGQDQGADLVHIAGCDVTIYGLVASTGPGHAATPDEPSRCRAQSDHDQEATGCVEIWAGGTLTIDRTGSHKGEVCADTAQAGGNKAQWIDLFARKDLVVKGPPADTVFAEPVEKCRGPFAVHANQYISGNTAKGGVLSVASTTGAVNASGQAFSGTSPKDGGHIELQSQKATNLDTAVVDMSGGVGGIGQSGGAIAAKAYSGNLTWASGLGDARPAPGNTIALSGCTVTTGNQATQFPATVPTVTNACTNGSPQVPSYVNLPICKCQPPPDCATDPTLPQCSKPDCTTNPDASGCKPPPCNPATDANKCAPPTGSSGAKVGKATLSGIKSGCIASSSTIRVTGSNISTVTFYVDGRKVKKTGKAPYKYVLKRSRYSVGGHKLKVKVNFTNGTNPVSTTKNVSFNRCGKPKVRFTG